MQYVTTETQTIKQPKGRPSLNLTREEKNEVTRKRMMIYRIHKITQADIIMKDIERHKEYILLLEKRLKDLIND